MYNFAYQFYLDYSIFTYKRKIIDISMSILEKKIKFSKSAKIISANIL